MTQELEKKITEDLIDTMSIPPEAYSDLKSSANKLLSELNVFKEKIKTDENIRNSFSNIEDIDKGWNVVIELLKRREQEVNEEKKNLLQMCLSFQDAIERAFNIEIILSFVNNQGEIKLIDKTTEAELWNNSKYSTFVVKDKRYKVSSQSFVNNNSFDIEKLVKRLVTDNNTLNKFDEHYRALQSLYSTITGQSFSKEKKDTPSLYKAYREKEGKKYFTHSFLVCDKTANGVAEQESQKGKGKYLFYYLNNLGILAEAYVAAVLAWQSYLVNDIFTDQTVSPDAKAIVLYKRYALKIDNLPGALGGDVSTQLKKGERGPSLEFAVKTNSFNSESLIELIKIAQFIQQGESGGNQKTRRGVIEDYLKYEHRGQVSQLIKQIDRDTTETLRQSMKNSENLGRILPNIMPNK